MIQVKSKKVNLNAFDVPGYDLPTFQRDAIIKTVYWKWWIFRIKIRRYLMFTYIAIIPGISWGVRAASNKEHDEFIYLKKYIKLKGGQYGIIN